MIPALIVLVLFLGTNLSILPYQHAADEQRALELVLLVASLAFSLANRDVRNATIATLDRHPRAVTLSLGFVGLGTASSVLALSPYEALRETSVHALLAWLVLVVAAAITEEQRATSTFLLVGLTATVLVYSLDYLTLPQLTERGLGLWSRGMRGGFSGQRYLGHFYVFLIPLGTALTLATGFARTLRIALGIATAAGWWSLVLTAERGAPLAMLVVGALLPWGVYRTVETRLFALRYFALAASGLVGGIVTRFFLVVGAGGGLSLRALADKDISSSSGRIELWEFTLDLILQRPALGVAPGHLAHVEFLMAPVAPTSPHNLPLKLAAEWGLPALGLVAVLGALGVRRAFERRELRVPDLGELGLSGSILRVAVMVGLGSGLALSLVSGVGATAVGQLLLATLLGWAVGLHLPPAVGHGRVTSTAGTRPATSVAAGVALVAACLTIYEVATTSPEDLRESETAAFERAGRTVLQPRFWTQGVIGIDGASDGSAR